MISNIKKAIIISSQLLKNKSLPEADLKHLESMKEQLEECLVEIEQNKKADKYLDRVGKVSKIIESITKVFLSIFGPP